MLNAFREQRPSLRFTLTDLPNSALIDAVRDGVVDIGIGVHEPEANHEALRFKDVFEDEIVVVLRRDDPLAKRKTLPWAKLVGRDLAVFVRGSVSDALHRTSGDEKLRLSVAYRMEYSEPLYALARNGLAIAVLPSLYTLHLHDPELVALRLDKPRVTRAIALISLVGEDRGPHVKACWDYIAAHI